MKSIIIFLISLYQQTISPLLVMLFGPGCRYEVSCSQFAKKAIQEDGLFKGGRASLVRIMSCHP